MSLEPIPQLIFSTRAARPRAGLEFNRELVAATPGIKAEVRGFFSLRADLTYSTSQQPKLAPVYTFSRVDRDRWLFTRAVSLGRYRKSSHQMLIHGLVLRRPHLEALAGNPFLLARLDGVELAGEHPGRRRPLPGLPLPTGIESHAGEMNRRRLEELRPVLEEHYAESFANLFELARSANPPVACVTPGQPSAELVEGLLLHFHSEDRLELGFHSWYAQDRRLDYRLLFASRAELPMLRRHFSPLEVWTPGRRGRSPVADLARELREKSVSEYCATVERFRLTWLRDTPVPRVADDDALLCLRHGLGQPLEAGERERCRRLARRAGNPLSACVYDLAEAWPRGYGAFAREAKRGLTRLGPVSRETAEQTLEEIAGPEAAGPPAAEDWIHRWTLLVLWPGFEPEVSGGAARARAFRRLVPPAHFEGLARTVLKPGVDGAASLLDDYVVLDAEALAGTAQLPARPYWPRYLRWLAGSGRGLQAMVPRLEAVIAGMRDRTRALAWLRRLQALCHQAGLAMVAYRLVFQHELELLEAAERPERIRQTLGALLADDSGASDKVLRTLLGRPRLSGDLWSAMADWILSTASPEDSWRRWRRLIANQGRVLELETARACGRFLGRLALSPLSGRMQASCRTLLAARAPEAPEIGFWAHLLEPAARRLMRAAARPPAPEASLFLTRSAAGLVSARVACRRPSRSLDQRLLDLLFFSFLHGGALARQAPDELELELGSNFDPARVLDELRQAARLFLGHLLSQEGGYFDDLLDAGLDEGSLPRVARRREWGHLLMDELIRSPPARGLDDPRFRSCLEIGLRQWRAEAEPTGAGLIRVLRLLHMPPPGARHLERTRQIVRRLVPGDRAHYARALLGEH